MNDPIPTRTDLATPQGRFDVLLAETSPWSPAAVAMALQTIRGLLEDVAALEARLAGAHGSPEAFVQEWVDAEEDDLYAHAHEPEEVARRAFRAGQDAAVAEYDRILTRQGDLLTRTVNVLKGAPPELVWWSHHDIPELAQKVMDELEAESARLSRIQELSDRSATYGHDESGQFKADLRKILEGDER